jgi:ribonuclease HI
VGSKKYYAVRRGRKTGIFTEWFGPDGAQAQVRGFKGAVYKGFPTRSEAEQFVKSSAAAPPEEKPVDEDGRLQVFTDGGAIGNPGPGGFGVVILEPGRPSREINGGFVRTTNNRMEMMGCITALEALAPEVPVTLHSDSRYLVDAVNKGWVYAWRKRGWRKADGTLPANIDLWQRLLPMLEARDVNLKWVRGHAGHVWNERCDQLVHEAIQQGNLRVDEGYDG